MPGFPCRQVGLVCSIGYRQSVGAALVRGLTDLLRLNIGPGLRLSLIAGTAPGLLLVALCGELVHH